MKRFLFVVAAFLAVLVVTQNPVRGCGYGMPSPLVRFALADYVLVGEIIQYELDPVVVTLNDPAKTKQEYRVAVIQVQHAIKGAEEVRFVRLGLMPHQIINTGYRGCYLLQDHPTESFSVLQSTYDYSIGVENNSGFDKQMEQFQAWAKLMKDPVAGMKSKVAADRLTTAALLLSRYRGTALSSDPNAKTREIDRTESKLIMETLADADWNLRLDFRVTTASLFQQLGAKDTDGWKPQQWKTPGEYQVAAKSWLRDHASTFRIMTAVP